jgi:hypothetical protein
MELNYKFGRLPSYTRLTFIVSAIVLFSISIQLYQHEQSFENLKFSKNINNQQIIKGNQLDYTLSQKIYLFDLHYIFQQSQRLICSDKVDFIPKVLHVLFFINRPYIHF